MVPLFVILFSCRASRTTSDHTVVTPVVVPDRPEKPDENEAENEPAETIDVVEGPEHGADKSAYQIALLLDFELDDHDLNLPDTVELAISRGAEISLGFYQGFQLALDEMSASGPAAEIYIYDSGNDPAATKKIFNNPEFPKTDIVIGPVFNKNLRAAAEICKQRKIPMISPLSSSTSITSSNPYYYSANGTSTAHYEALAHHIRKNYPGETVYVIHQGTQKEREVIDIFSRIGLSAGEKKANPLLEIEMTTESTKIDLRNEFDSLGLQVVLIPSYDEIFANFALNQLAQIKTYYPSIVYGMPTWKDFSTANYDYYEWLNVHITASSWTDELSNRTANFKRNFSLRYGMQPSEYAVQGYDLAHFVMAFLAGRDPSRRDKERFFTIEDIYSGIQGNYNFIPRYQEGSDEIDFWDNAYIHILEFKNYTYNKVD